MTWGEEWQRAIAEQFVEAALEKAGITSADKYYAWLRENELGVTRRIAREVWREYRESFMWLTLLERYPERQIIPRRWFSETSSEYIDRYGYKVNLTYVDPESGETKTKPWLVKSDVPLTLEDLDDILTRGLPQEYPQLFREITDYNVTRLYHRRGSKW